MELCVAHEIYASDLFDDCVISSNILTDLASSSAKGLGSLRIVLIGVL
jgi:hypothetical protein